MMRQGTTMTPNAEPPGRESSSPAGIPINTHADVVIARRKGRELGAGIGFSVPQQTVIATAIAELGMNALQYAGGGQIHFSIIDADARLGLQIKVEDQGPGIPDIRRVLLGGYSTSGGLGIGLSGIQRLMDKFELQSNPEQGTRVTVIKWK